MSDHNPLCPATVGRYVRGTGLTDNECQCDLIARVLADERSRTHVTSTGLSGRTDYAQVRSEVLADLRARIADEAQGRDWDGQTVSDILSLLGGDQ